MFELLGAGIANIVQFKYLLPLLIGTVIGVVGGALPGITITMTIIVVLPFTFGLEPLQGLSAMIGVYVGGETGGLITSCLLGIPGKPSAVATTFDGFPMARNGEPGRAIWLGIWASILGGLLGAVFLVATTGPLAQIALQFGPWEFFSLFVLALSMVAGLVEASLLKGLVAGALGMIVTILGNDPVMGQKRLTLGIPALEGGIDFLPVLIGVFAFAQIMSEVERMGGGRKAAEAVDHGVKIVVSHGKGRLSSAWRSAYCRRSAAAPPTCSPTTRPRSSRSTPSASAPARPKASSPRNPRITPTSQARSSRSWPSAFRATQ